MKLTDHYDGSNDAFEGDVTLQWRSLPQNALVTKATLKATPTAAAGTTLFTETVSFVNGQGDLGATKNPSNEVDFHKRRTLYSVTDPSLTNAGLQVDMGGLYVEINSNGAIKTPGDTPFKLPASGILPGLTVSKFKLTSTTGTVRSVTVLSHPTNLTVRLGALPPFWTRLGELAVAETSPDFTTVLQAFLLKADKQNGFYQLPIVLHSDNVCRLNLDLEVEYVLQANLQPDGVKEVVLPYDYSTTPKASAGGLSLKLPATAMAVSGGSSTSVKGAFDGTRIVYGPTGIVTPGDIANISPSVSPAQMLSLATALGATGIDLLLTAVSRIARLALDLRGDLDGKPDSSSLLPSPVGFTLDGTVAAQPTWVNVPLASEFHFQDKNQQRYWVVLQCLEGEARWSVQQAPADTTPLQQTQDGGFSWRTVTSAKASGGLMAYLRLRSTPERFQVPIELQVGEGQQAVRVGLDQFQPLGRVDFALDPSALSRSVNAYTEAAYTPQPKGEQLANGDFSAWSVVGNAVGAPFSISVPGGIGGIVTSPDGRWVYVGLNSGSTARLGVVSVICDEVKASLQLTNLQQGGVQAVAVHPDGSRIYALGPSSLDLLDATTWTELGSLPLAAFAQLKLPFATFGSGLALSPDGSMIYATTTSPAIVGLSTVKLEQVALGRSTLATQDVNVLLVDPNLSSNSVAAAIAVSPDGSRLYATVPAANKLSVIDVASKDRTDVPTGALPGPFVLTPDGGLAIVGNTGDNSLSLIDTSSQRSSSINLPGEPVGLALSPDGTRVFVATLASETVNTVNGVNVVDLDRHTVESPVTLPGPPSAIAISPQGDRIYAGVTSIFEDPLNIDVGSLRGGSFFSSAGDLVVFPVGVRLAAEWTVTSGQTALFCLPEVSPPGLVLVLGHRSNVSDLTANETATAFSQVVPVAESSSYTFSFKGLASDSGAVAEVFWLGQNCGAVQTDTVPIKIEGPSRTGPILPIHSARLIAPAGAEQAEVRFSSPAGVIAGIAEVSMSATSQAVSNGDLESQDGRGGLSQWSAAAQSPAIVITTVGGTTVLKNPASQPAVLVQPVELTAGKSFTVAVEGRAVELTSSTQDVPRVEVHYLAKDNSEAGPPVQLAIGVRDFPQHAANGTVPDASAQAEVHLILPPGTALAADQISVQAQAFNSVPLTFISQAPGELRVSGANIAYDEAPAEPVPVPAKGLCNPTPPGSEPGQKAGNSCYCSCCQEEQAMANPTPAITAAGRPAVVSRCTNCGTENVRGGGTVAAGAQQVGLRMLPSHSAVPAAKTPLPLKEAAPALDSIQGIRNGRVQQLAGAGITSMADLAGSTPAKVAAAMTGVSTKNAATFIQAARAALISAAATPSRTTSLFQPTANLVTESQPKAPEATESQSDSLASMPGLGHRRIALLSAAGIDSIEKLAGATPAQVAKALKKAGVSHKSAKVFIDRAMHLTVRKHTQLVG